MHTIRLRPAAAAALTVTAALWVTGCGAGDATTSTDAGYAITGTVKVRQVDQDCKTTQHRPLSGLVAGTSRPAPPAKPAAPAPAATSPPRRATSAPKPPAPAATGRTKRGTTPTTGTGAWTAPKPVKIDPRRVPTAPTVTPRPHRPGVICHTEYELFIENADGVFEQDVPAAHYWPCDEVAAFAHCTQGAS